MRSRTDGICNMPLSRPPWGRSRLTQADQVDQLVSASEADPERGFMARLMALLSSHEPVARPWCDRGVNS